MQKMLVVLCFIFIGLLSFLHFFRPVTAINEDLGRHLLLGKIIFETQAVPTTNLFSYTYPDQLFINSHWLSEVIFYIIHDISGFNGLIIFSTVIAATTFYILLLFFRKRASIISLIFATSLYSNILFERTNIRPEIFSLLFLSFFITILYTYRSRFTKLLFLIVPLQILWVNMHIYFFVGIIVLLLFFLDQLFITKFHFTKSVKILTVVILLSLFGCVINPNGIYGAIFPFTVFQNYAFPVVENQSVFTLIKIYQIPTLFYFFIAIIILFSSFLFRNYKQHRIDLLLIICFSLATFAVFRNVSLFAIATFIPFVSAISSMLENSSTFIKHSVGGKYFIVLKIYLLFIIVLLLLSQIAKVVTTQKIGFGVDEYGKSSANFFLENKIQGPLYNNFDIGSYLIYRLYPQKVFVDGRPEAYPKEFFQKIYLPLQENPKKFTQTDNYYHFNTLFISHWNQTPWKDNSLLIVLKNPHYSLIYLDDYALILVKNTEENKTIIQKNKITKNNFKIPNITSKEELIRYLYFFEKAGWKNQKNDVLKKLQIIDPQNSMLNKYKNALTNKRN